MNATRVFTLLALAAASAAGVPGQTAIDLRAQSRNIDFSGAVSTKPIKVGSALPAVCSTGEFFYKTPAAVGQNLYSCTAANTWSVVSSGGGGGGAHADQHKHGGFDEVSTSTPAANAIPKADAGGKLSEGWLPPGSYSANYSSSLLWTLAGSVHGLQSCDLSAAFFEITGTAVRSIAPDSFQCERLAGPSQFDISVAWSVPQSGRMVLVKNGGSGSGGGGDGSAVWGGILGTLSAQSDLQTALTAKEALANKNTANGYAGLGAGGKLSAAQGAGVWAVTDLSDVLSKRGNSTQVQMTTGATANNDCAKFDANGNLVSSGAACGVGGGGGDTLVCTEGQSKKWVNGAWACWTVPPPDPVVLPPDVFQALTATASLDFPNIPAASYADLTISVPGAATGDAVDAGWPTTLHSGLLGMMFVSAADTVTVRLRNVTGSGIDLGNSNFRATVVRPY
jgi:hypothetical protein